MAEQVIVKTAGRGLGRFFGAWFKYGLYGIFIFILLLQGFFLSYQSGSVLPFFEVIRDTFLRATLNIQEKSLEIISNEGINGSLFDWIFTIGGFFWNLWSVFIQIKVITWFTKMPDSSRKFQYWSLAILLFIVFQVIGLLLLYEPLDGQTKFDLALTPIKAFIDLFRALPYVFTSFSLDMSANTSTCSDGTCVI